MHAVRWVWAAAVVGASTAACSAILGLDPPSGAADGGPGADATTPGDGSVAGGDGSVEAADGGVVATDGGPTDATVVDGAFDAAPTCAPLGTDGAVTYNPLGQVDLDDAGTQTWDFFNVTALTAGAVNTYAGGVFDNRYVYFAGRGQWVVRYDTTAGAGSFTEASAWSSVRVSSLGVPGTIPGGFFGAVFDGRYVYFVPYEVGSSQVSVAARFDTQGVFDAGASWSSFDLSTLAGDGGAPLSGFTGGVFDGRYVYFVPRNDGSPDGRVVRYDTFAAADAGAPADGGAAEGGPGDAGAADAHPSDAGPSDAASIDGGSSDAASVDGGSIDAGDGGGGSAGVGFSNPAYWSTFDVSSTNPAATGFAGGVFDGRALYLVPNVNDAFDAEVHGGSSGIVASYRVDAGFQDAASWSTFDVTRVNSLATNFIGGAFDGHYVYLAPRGSGVALQLDPAGGFQSVPAWSAYDLTRIIARDGGIAPYFLGTAYDGRFVYFIPTTTGFATVARYDTLSPFTADCAWSTVDLSQVDPVDGGPQSFAGAVFDGQYVYLVPMFNGLAARFEARTPAATPPFTGSFL
jgi:hypothetical protein